MKDNNIANDYLDNSEIELSRIFYLTSLKASRKVNIDILASEAERKLTRNAFNLALKEMVKFLETSQFQNDSFSVT